MSLMQTGINKHPKRYRGRPVKIHEPYFRLQVNMITADYEKLKQHAFVIAKKENKQYGAANLIRDIIKDYLEKQENNDD